MSANPILYTKAPDQSLKIDLIEEIISLYYNLQS